MISKRRYFLYNFFIISLFALTSILMTFWFAQNGKIFEMSDFPFHASRVEQIYLNLKHGVFFNFVSTNVLQQTGVATFLFYPFLFLYPWAIFMQHFSFINSYFMWYTLFNFLSFLISYFCMKSYSHDFIKSLIFSYLYVLAPYRIYTSRWVLGEFLTSIFLPIAFLGFYEILERNNKHWYLLSIGIALISYCHILSVFIIFEIFIALIIIKCIFGTFISLSKLKALLKSSLLCIFLVLPIIVPFFTDLVGKEILTPNAGIVIIANPFTVVQESISNSADTSSIGIIFFIVLLFGWKLVKTTEDKLFYWIGLMLTIFSSSIFPWESFSHGFLSTVQLTYRYLLYSSFFLALVASSTVKIVYESKYFKKFKTFSPYFFSIFIASIGLLSYFSSTTTISNLVAPQSSQPYLKAAPEGKVQRAPSGQIDAKNYAYIFDYAVPYGETDYYPKSSLANSDSIINNLAYIDQKQKKLVLKGEPNKIKFKLKLSKKANINSPVLAYSHSYLIINGKKTKYSISDRGTVQFKLSKGNYNISIGYKAPPIYYISLIVTITCWIILFIFLFFKKRV